MVRLNRLRRWPLVSAALAVIGLADSLYLFSSKFGRPLVCGVGDCDLVNASPYSEVMGIPVSFIGALGYAFLLALAAWALARGPDAPDWLIQVRLFVGGLGLLFSVYLTAIELFLLHTI